MEKIRFIVFLITLLTTGFFCTAAGRKSEKFHPGYVIIGQDTVTGLILVQDHFTSSKQCVFKDSYSGTTRTYSPDDLVGYGVNGKSFFYTAEIRNGRQNGQKVFLECIVKGGVSLFYYHDRFFVKSENEFEELVELKEQVQRDGKPYTIKRPLYKSVLQKQMDECPVIHEKLASATLSRKDLTKLFVDYAECIGKEAVVFEAVSKGALNVRYGFALGVLVADLKLKSQSNYRYSFGEHASGDPSVSFAPSFFVDLPVSRKFDLSTGLNWYHTKNELRAESSLSNVTQDFFLETSRVEVPLLLKYTPARGNIQWSIKAGCGFNGVLKYDSRLVESTSSGYVLNEHHNDLNKNNLFLNAMGGVGAEFLLGERSFVVEGYYSRSGSIVQSGTYAGFSGIKLSLGMFL